MWGNHVWEHSHNETNIKKQEDKKNLNAKSEYLSTIDQCYFFPLSIVL
jgi:hypothetical protein